MSEMLDPKEALIDIYCKQLKLPGLKVAFRDLARDAMTQNQTPTAFLTACLATELDARAQRRLTARLRQAKFPEAKTIENSTLPAYPNCPKQQLFHYLNASSSKKKKISFV